MASRVVYDNFDSYSVGTLPTTGVWSQDGGFRDLPQVVTSASDGGLGPRTGSNMLSLDAQTSFPLSDHRAFQNAVLNSWAYTNETFIRVYGRFDANHNNPPPPNNADGSPGASSPRKIFRVFHQGAGFNTLSYNDIFDVWYGFGGGTVNGGGQIGGQGSPTYWGGATGDNTTLSNAWHKFEFYFNAANGVVRCWHDGILIRDDVYSPVWTAPMYPFNLCSNWSNGEKWSTFTHNYFYVDDVEVFSDSSTGTVATGLMSDATIAVPSVALAAPVGEYFRPR